MTLTSARPSTLRRLLLPLAALPLVATSLLTVPTAAHAVAPTEPTGVTGADLPQTVRVARIFRYLEGGTRELSRSDRLDVPGRTCITQSPGVPAESVRWASYVQPDGEMPFFVNREDPTFFVYEFASPARARQALLRLVDYTARCRTTHRQSGTAVTVSRAAVPRLGDRELAYRTLTEYGSLKVHSLEIYVRQGKRIERSWVQVEGRPADLRRTVRMARMLADTSRG